MLSWRDAVGRMDRVRLEDKGSGKSIAAVTIEMAVMGDGRGDGCVCGMDIRAAATPFAQESWYSAGLASFLILVVSAGLGMIAPLMQSQLAS
jgi:hypothetical protein